MRKHHLHEYSAPAAIGALLLAVQPLVGCFGGPPAPGTGGAVQVTISGTPTLNRCGRDTSYPLNCRVLMVSDTSPIKGLGLKQVWGKESDVFGASLVAAPRDIAVAPGQSDVVMPIERPATATAVIVVGNFFCARDDGWYVEMPLPKTKKLHLLAGMDSLVVAR